LWSIQHGVDVPTLFGANRSADKHVWVKPSLIFSSATSRNARRIIARQFLGRIVGGEAGEDTGGLVDSEQ